MYDLPCYEIADNIFVGKKKIQYKLWVSQYEALNWTKIGLEIKSPPNFRTTFQDDKKKYTSRRRRKIWHVITVWRERQF